MASHAAVRIHIGFMTSWRTILFTIQSPSLHAVGRPFRSSCARFAALQIQNFKTPRLAYERDSPFFIPFLAKFVRQNGRPCGPRLRC